MNLEKWFDIKTSIKDKFIVLTEIKEDLADIPNGFKETIEFQNQLGKMKLVYVNHPLLTDTTTISSKRAGSVVKVNKVYSPTEKVGRFKAYKWIEDKEDWEELKSEMFS